MTHWLPESLLEMHYHRALVDYYARKFSGKFVRLLKPSPQREAWVGFDQGWTVSDLTESELFSGLRNAVREKRATVDRFYLGEFLQFKVVDQVNRRSRRTPPGTRTPYYRSALSLNPTKTTGLSQHETLMRLRTVANAAVFYACGMLFSQEELWRAPDLATLRFVDLSTAPSGWSTNESHFIIFEAPDDPHPKWCSDPVSGDAFTIDQLATRGWLPRPMESREALQFVHDSAAVLSNVERVERIGNTFVRYLPECLSLYEFERI